MTLSTSTTLCDDYQTPSDSDMPSKSFARMIANGRCIHQIRYLSRVFDSDTFSYLSFLKRSPTRQESHQKCSEENCIAYNIDMAHYKIRHTTDGCPCDMVSVPYSKLVKMIRRNEVPLISVESCAKSPSGVKLQVHSRVEGSSYVAVSHVWADGLGNPNCNALPTCQLSQFKPRVCKAVSHAKMFAG